MRSKAKPQTKVAGTLLGRMLALAAAVVLPASLGAVTTTIDLTSTPVPPGTSVTTDGGVIYSQTDQQPTGTGYIKPFLRVQGNSSAHSLVTDGYNTDDAKEKNPMWDKSYPWTHDLMLSDLQATDGYYCFLLDANQEGDDPKLTMSQFTIWVGDAADNSYDTKAALETAYLGHLIYDMVADDLSGDDIVGLDLAVQNTNGFDANNGSGSGDLYVYIPTSLFASATGDYLILYSEFGAGTYAQNDGFEEWAACTGVPDGGSTLALLGVAIIGLGLVSRRAQLALNKA